MKKIMSMLLVICMVCTALIGTMAVDVNASYDFTNEDSTITHTHTFDATATKGFDVGTWYLSNGDVSVKLGETADNVSNAGMTFKKIQFDAGELTGITGTAGLQFRTEVGSDHYLSIDSDPTYSADDIGQQGLSVSALNTSTKYTSETTNRAAIYTLYAYSKTTTGEPLVLNLNAGGRDSTSHKVSISAEDLYSQGGAPHKIDIVLYRNKGAGGAFSGAGYVLGKVYVDGLFFTGFKGKHDWSLSTEAKVTETMSVRLTPADGSLSWGETEWYVFTPVQGVDDYVASSSNISRNTTTNYIFESTVNWDSQGTAGTPKTDVVDDGVNTDVEALINNALLTDKCNEITIPGGYYKNPALIYDNDENTVSNVKIVEKATGTVYNEENLPPEGFTFDDAYLCVEGVYLNVKAKYIEYNKEEKKATVLADVLPEGTTCQIIVASYNDDDSLKSIKVSEQKTATAGAAISYKADGLLEGTKYRVFVFDSITTAVPLIDSLVVGSN